MYQDILATFDDKVTMNGMNVGTVLCTSSYDTSAAGSPAAVGPGGAIGGTLLHDIGRGRRVKLVVQITTAVAAAGGAATVEVDFICADDGPLTVNKTVLLATAAIAKATLVSGYRFRFGSTPGVVPRQFVGVQYVVATNNLTAGNVSAFLALDVDDNADILG